MREIGLENFYYEVLEEVPNRDDLNEREIYWISHFNSYRNGYNGTPGGETLGKAAFGEHNGRAKLTEEDVYNIREMYNNHIPFREVYKIYKDKIGKRGLQHVWHFEHWKYIHPEYNNEENRLWHSTAAKANPSEVAANNKRAFSNEQVLEMRRRYENGESIAQIWHDGYSDHTKSTVRNAILKITYKDVN